MSQYIDVYFDDDPRNYNNVGLYELIQLIGASHYDGKKVLLQREAYIRGKRIINSKLNKQHGKAIDRLVSAKKKRYNYNGVDTDECKPLWKIHRSKAAKIFRVIYEIVRKYNSKIILDLFWKVRAEYGFNSGAEVIGYPYCSKINDELFLESENYTEQEIRDLTKCGKEIDRFNYI